MNQPATQPITQPGTKILSPEDLLRNVANILIEETRVVRSYNGRGRPAVYAANVDAIAATGTQLAEMILAYLEGELNAVEVDANLPF